MNRYKQTYLKFKPMADDLRKAESWCELDGVLNRNKTMQNLYKMGYRKASDVAREIFEEIEKALDDSVETEHFKGTWFNFSKFKQRLAELKKKYEYESEG